MKKLLLLVMAILMAGLCFAEEEKTWLLAMKSDKDLKFQAEISLQARTRLAMMFMPEQEIFMRMHVLKSFLMKALRPDGKYESESVVATATLENYVAGQPNQKMEEELLNDILWTSGIGGRGAIISGLHDPNGKIYEIKGVPEKYVRYFQNDLMFFPDKPVKIGETWKRTFEHPLAFDPNQEPILCQVDVSYKLEKVLEEKNEAEVSFAMTTASDHIIQNGQKVSAAMKLERTGTMKLKLYNCVPFKTISNSYFIVEFSKTNYIKSDEIYEATYKIIDKAN
ncbi:MAG: DUF6263 family protein [Candidatus Riflebacteria bacterium]